MDLHACLRNTISAVVLLGNVRSTIPINTAPEVWRAEEEEVMIRESNNNRITRLSKEAD